MFSFKNQTMAWAVAYALIGLSIASEPQIDLQINDPEAKIFKLLGQPEKTIKGEVTNYYFKSKTKNISHWQIVTRDGKTVEIKKIFAEPQPSKSLIPDRPVYVALPSQPMPEDIHLILPRIGDPARGMAWSLTPDQRITAISLYAPWPSKEPLRSVQTIITEASNPSKAIKAKQEGKQ